MELAKRISEDILMKMKCGEFITPTQRARVFRALDKYYEKTDEVDKKVILILSNNQLKPLKEPLHEEEIIYLIKEWKGD